MAQFGLARLAVLAVLLLYTMGGWAAAPRAQADDGPRLGEYELLIDDVRHHYMVLKPGGVYEIYYASNREFRGRGTYRYDAAAKRVVWLSGLNYEMGRGGTFETGEGGRIHRIRLSPSSMAVNGR
jgi:hypothetical protein